MKDMNKIKVVCEVSEDYKTKIKISSSKDIYDNIKPFFDDVINYKERMAVICINKANHIIGYNVLSEGGVSGTTVDVKIIMQHAILTNSSNIILIHNHPSGNLKASNADIMITKKVSEACKVMDITLLDHLIITDESFYSFADNGQI